MSRSRNTKPSPPGRNRKSPEIELVDHRHIGRVRRLIGRELVDDPLRLIGSTNTPCTSARVS